MLMVVAVMVMQWWVALTQTWLNDAVVGCSDPDVMPEQTWFERSDDGLTATIGCVNADVKWSVRCVDNTWLGYHANCTLGKYTEVYLPRDTTPTVL